MRFGVAAGSLLLMGTPLTAHAVCAGAPISADSLRTAIDAAIQEYPKFNDGDFRGQAATVIETLPCLSEIASKDLAARIHRLVGLRARIEDGTDQRARLAFASARAADTTYDLPSWLAGPLDPERAEYVAIPLDLISKVEARQPTEGTVVFDGLTDRQRPANVPTLFQHAIGTHVTDTVYLWPKDPTPDYPMVPIYEEAPPGPGRLIVSGGSAAAAGAGGTLIALAGWDIANICSQEPRDVCRLQARDRIIGGTVMVVAGTAGFLVGQYFLEVGPANVNIGMRW